MKLKSLGANKTEVELNSDIIVFFSYQTPVASYSYKTGKFYRTDHKWSVTTSKHINQWLDGAKAEERPQSFFDSLAEKAA